MIAMANKTKNIVTAGDLLTIEQYFLIMEYGSIAWTVLPFLGLISNVINITTFVAMGLTDGVTVSFLLLSLFDLSYLMVGILFGVATGLSAVEAKSTLRYLVEPFGLCIFAANVMFLLNVTNTLTTTFIAVARCMCVAKPLHFKNTFSRSRTLVFNIGFATFATGIYIPVLAHMAILPKTDKLTNITRPSLWISKHREHIKEVVWLMTNTVLPLLTEVIIIVCVFVMVNSLRTSSKFRQASTLSSASAPPKNNEIDRFENFQTSETKTSNKVRGKEQRVVQQVILISTVYIMCNTPKIIISFVGIIEPQFSVLGIYKNLHVIIHSLAKYLDICNASVNTFIYYSYNTKFRTNLRSFFGR